MREKKEPVLPLPSHLACLAAYSKMSQMWATTKLFIRNILVFIVRLIPFWGLVAAVYFSLGGKLDFAVSCAINDNICLIFSAIYLVVGAVVATLILFCIVSIIWDLYKAADKRTKTIDPKNLVVSAFQKETKPNEVYLKITNNEWSLPRVVIDNIVVYHTNRTNRTSTLLPHDKVPLTIDRAATDETMKSITSRFIILKKERFSIVEYLTGGENPDIFDYKYGNNYLFEIAIVFGSKPGEGNIIRHVASVDIKARETFQLKNIQLTAKKWTK